MDRRPRRSGMPNSLFSGIALFKNSFGVVPYVREEKKDNTDENRCENITSPALAPRLTDFYKSTDLKLRSYKMCRIKAFQGWVVKAGGEILMVRLRTDVLIPPCCSLDTFCQYRKYHSRHIIWHKRRKVCARKENSNCDVVPN